MNDNNRTPDGTQIVYVSHKSIGSFHTMSSNRFLLCPFDVAFISPSFYSPSFFFRWLLWRCSSSNEYKMVARIRLIAQTSKPKGSVDIIQTQGRDTYTQQVSCVGSEMTQKVFSLLQYIHISLCVCVCVLSTCLRSDERRPETAERVHHPDRIPYHFFICLRNFTISFSFRLKNVNKGRHGMGGAGRTSSQCGGTNRTVQKRKNWD